MGRRVNPAVVGAFVVGGVLLLVSALTIWGLRRVRERRYEYVSYFSGSLSGLKIGAPVKLFGMQIANVSRIRVYSFDHPENLQIGVYIAFSAEQLRGLGARRAPTPEVVRESVRNGLRARLGGANLLTRERSVDLDFVPEVPAVYREPQGAERVPEIPTAPPAPSPELKALDDLAAKLDDVDFKALFDSITRAANGIGNASGQIGHLAGNLDGRLDHVEGLLDGVIGAEAPSVVELRRVLASMDKAARELGSLAEYLRRNPSSLIRGKPAEGQ